MAFAVVTLTHSWDSQPDSPDSNEKYHVDIAAVWNGKVPPLDISKRLAAYEAVAMFIGDGFRLVNCVSSQYTRKPDATCVRHCLDLVWTLEKAKI